MELKQHKRRKTIRKLVTIKERKEAENKQKQKQIEQKIGKNFEINSFF